jgi:C1A family cysteine protease/PKD repeat protein
MSFSKTQPISIIALTLLTAVPAFSQLDRQAIADMQAEADREGWTFTVGENSATQYPLEQICGLREPEGWQKEAVFDPMTTAAKLVLPVAFDWRSYDGCTPVRNQGGCGSCWAFATVGALECAIKIREGVSTNLSEQWLVSCNRSGWSCSGGWYAHSYHGWSTDGCGGTGAVLEADFPYVASDAPCGCPYPHHYLIDSWAYIGNGGSVAGVEEMKRAILENGPISVSVHVNNPFQAYRGGVFNYCTDGEINHAVVLVGWDNTQGQSGVWIMRNSWGSGWGESGYMRIEYSCCQIGYAACYIDYRPVIVTPQNEFGPAPLTVDFQSEAPGATVTGCAWEFGDGETSSETNPTHTYITPGCYTVKLTVNTSTGDLVKICPNLVSAHADSMRAAQVEMASGGPVRMEIAVRNYLNLDKLTIPFYWDGPFNLRFDSFTVSGTRAGYFDDNFMISFDPNNRRAAIVLTPGNQAPLPPGDGPVASLWFTAPSGVTGLNLIRLLGYSKYSPQFVSGDHAYQPALTDGFFYVGISIACCDGHVGDVNQSGEDEPTIGDVSMLIDHLFISGTPLGCVAEADVNQSGGVAPTYDDLTISDVSMLIDHLFISGQPLAECL